MTPHPRKARSAISVAFLVLASLSLVAMTALLGPIVVRMYHDHHPSARPVAQEYLDAISSGDATRALALTSDHADMTLHASTALLTDDVLRGASQRISNVQITRVPSALELGDSARIGVRYTVGGHDEQASLYLEWDAASGWRVQSGLLGSVSMTGSRYVDNMPFTVSGVAASDATSFCRDGCSQSRAYLLFPGVYRVRASLDGWVLDPRDSTPIEQQVMIQQLWDSVYLHYRASPAP
jgi:hypothetical protein